MADVYPTVQRLGCQVWQSLQRAAVHRAYHIAYDRAAFQRKIGLRK